MNKNIIAALIVGSSLCYLSLVGAMDIANTYKDKKHLELKLDSAIERENRAKIESVRTEMELKAQVNALEYDLISYNYESKSYLKVRYEQLLKHVIDPVLRHIDLDTSAMRNLMIVTIHAETKGGMIASNYNNADFGITQVNKRTHYDRYEHYLNYPENKILREKILALASNIGGTKETPYHLELARNDAYAVGMGAIVYHTREYRLNNRKNLNQLCQVWLDVYNTREGKGTMEKCTADFPKEILI